VKSWSYPVGGNSTGLENSSHNLTTPTLSLVNTIVEQWIFAAFKSIYIIYLIYFLRGISFAEEYSHFTNKRL